MLFDDVATQTLRRTGRFMLFDDVATQTLRRTGRFITHINGPYHYDVALCSHLSKQFTSIIMVVVFMD
jgi:hypothetical protein